MCDERKINGNRESKNGSEDLWLKNIGLVNGIKCSIFTNSVNSFIKSSLAIVQISQQI